MVKKIDFHIHTIPSEKDYTFSYSSTWIKEYAKETQLDAIAITNHDLFDKQNFGQVKKDVSDIKVFPGMELSLEEGHVNVVFSEDNIDNLVAFSEWLKTQNLGENGKVSAEDYCENMKNWEQGIYIFELGKSNSLSVPDKLSTVTAVGGVSSQLKFQLFHKKTNELTPVLFSDAHASEDDSEEKRRDIALLKEKITFIQIDNCSFDEIKNSISDKTKVATNEGYLNDIIDIEGHTVSTGLNLIVGNRGTGKTEFLKKIKSRYDKDDIYDIPQFATAKADEYIERQRKEQKQEALDNWKKQYTTQFTAIAEYISSSDEIFDNEVDEFLDSVKKFAKDITDSNSGQKYQLFKEAKFEKISVKNLETYLNDLKKLIDNKKLWELLKEPQGKKKVFIETYHELRDFYVRKSQKNKIQKEVNEILNSVKKIVQSKTGIISPSDCEFTKVVRKNQIEKSINKFMNELIIERELKKEEIYGYQIIVKLTPYQSAKEFLNDRGANEAVKDGLITPYLEKDYIKFLKNLKEKQFYNPSNLAEYLMHLEVQLLDSDGTPASGGQAVGFALMMRLDEAKTKLIILIDEPEASLDNAYIRDELIRAIRGLKQYGSSVFVVTHNSTLGALLEPDYLVVTTKDEDKNYHILSGEFTSHTISDNDMISEVSYEKFVEAMEAGFETYTKKGELYESLRSR